ncbi:M13 family metallopeptidase [Aquisalinus flavus]|uniref:Zinc metalloprotease n=1 Tax=Aquisalinus flavus TaxID=1526572 RepID=A0A8J2Y4R5_9PROT|nr:M13-type metalloendopeptidase [Aquisalinus flavus]MBD0427380.1 M13 family peptidase [Aquisalinus flavus]UNE47185.1 M13 family peptidase [Aquisalinus flavus]GGD00533.1 zinc metalloprotease [Aquisalinus flavus]
MKKFLLGGVAALALVACGNETTSDQTAAPENQTDYEAEGVEAYGVDQGEGPELGTFGIELSDMKTEIDPGDDFFRYVNGQWLDEFEIPAEFSNYGSFTVLFERSEERVKNIIESAASSDAAQGSVEQKIGDYYASYLDTGTINEKGLSVLDDHMAAIDALESHDDVARAFGDPQLGVSTPFSPFVNVDSKQPDRYITYLTQSGLGLPNRGYYTDEGFAEEREAYRAYLADLMTMAGMDNAQERANAVYDLENELAMVHWEPAKRRERDLTYNLVSAEELQTYAPDFPWPLMLNEAGLGGETQFVLRENDAIQASAGIFAETPVEVWKDYMRLHLISTNADVLPSEFDDANFAFFGTKLRGVTEQRERWKRGVAAVNGTLGEAVGQVYVEDHFPPESKAKMEELVDNLKAAFRMRLENLDWMTEETKQEAFDKLDAFNTKIGYPDEWTDYSDLEVIEGDAFGNQRRAGVWAWNDMISKLGKPIDRSEWFMNPQTVNAYYNPPMNEIVFPAAILQAPFFDPEADDAVNYGGIGAVIGHEIGHGFDDQGRKSDGTGLLRDWWTEADAEAFEEKTAALGAQYETYSPIEGFFVDPNLTMGENIGDLGGLTMAYDAYKLSLNGEEAPVLDGYTGDQRFFMAWAQVWKRKYREEELKNRLTTDPHSPSEYRTNGVVRNMDAWYDAFEVAEDDELYLAPDARVRIW